VCKIGNERVQETKREGQLIRRIINFVKFIIEITLHRFELRSDHPSPPMEMVTASSKYVSFSVLSRDWTQYSIQLI
jgi:hypothetical protein